MTKFNEQRLMTILRAPTISEKSTFVADKHQQVVFEVAADATKPEIKAAVDAAHALGKKIAVHTYGPDGARGATAFAGPRGGDRGSSVAHRFLAACTPRH